MRWTPSAVDDALRALLKDRHGKNHAFAPARVNLSCDEPPWYRDTPPTAPISPMFVRDLTSSMSLERMRVTRRPS